MKTFVILNTVETLTTKNSDKKAVIVKVQKQGTKRTFFAVQNKEGKYICTTMFARKYDAKNISKRYLESV